MRHHHAFPDRQVNGHTLDVGGDYQWRKDGEAHLFSPQIIHTLQKAVRTGNYETFKQYSALVNEQMKQLYTLRGLLDFKKREPIPHRGSRIGRGDPQALQDRRDELRLDLAGGARRRSPSP